MDETRWKSAPEQNERNRTGPSENISLTIKLIALSIEEAFLLPGYNWHSSRNPINNLLATSNEYISRPTGKSHDIVRSTSTSRDLVFWGLDYQYTEGHERDSWARKGRQSWGLAAPRTNAKKKKRLLVLHQSCAFLSDSFDNEMDIYFFPYPALLASVFSSSQLVIYCNTKH